MIIKKAYTYRVIISVGVAVSAIIIIAGFIGYTRLKSSKRAQNVAISAVQIQPQSMTTTSPSPKTSTEGILKGQVTCNDKVDPVPCSTTIEIQPLDSELQNISIKVNETGEFRKSLPPGRYQLRPSPKQEYPIFVPQFISPVAINSEQTTEVVVSYHSGLR